MDDGDVHADWVASVRGRKPDSFMKIIFAVTLRDRLRGLHGYQNFSGVLVLAPCCDIHTFGMKQPLDVAFVARDGRVMKSICNLLPGRRVKCPGAAFVMERYACDRDWPDERHRIRFDWSEWTSLNEEREEDL